MIGPRPGAVSAATVLGAGGAQPYDAALAAIAAAAPDNGLATTTAPGIVELAQGGEMSPTAAIVVKSSDVRLLMALLFAF